MKTMKTLQVAAAVATLFAAAVPSVDPNPANLCDGSGKDPSTEHTAWPFPCPVCGGDVPAEVPA